MPIHPDLTAHRAVDACGGSFSAEQEASGYAAGFNDALGAACEAVKKADALTAELLEAAKYVLRDLQLKDGAYVSQATLRIVINKAEGSL